jgi:hypothetical protein
MSSYAAQPKGRKPSREEALAIANARVAARARRTMRIRKGVVVLALAAFLGPFAVIFEQVAAGTDPGLASTSSTTAASAPATKRTSGSTTTGSSGSTGSTGSSGSTGSTSTGSTTSGSTSSGSTTSGSTSTSSPAPVTTQQS